jgi:hypothetical protein
MLQREFQLLVTSSTVLITLAHYLKGDGELVARIGEEVLKPLQDLDTGRMLEAIEDVLSHLPADRRQSSIYVLTQCTSPADMVHKFMAGQMRAIVGVVMLSGQGRVLHDTRFLQAATPMMQFFFASKFALFATVFHFFATLPYFFATPPSFFATK